MRLPRRVLSAVIVVLAFLPVAALCAQDTRTVNEPVFPGTCTTLTAQQAITSGEPASETTLDIARIQAALNACGATKAVELTTSGTNNAILIAPLSVPTGVTLLVDAGVTVFGSRNPADYQVSTAGVETCGTVGTKGNGCNPLLSVNGGATSSGAGIMGYGIINGRGGDKLLLNGVAQTYSWWALANQANTGTGAQNNPILIYATKASNFTLYKINLLNSPMFHVKYQNASGFTAWGIKIVAPYTARNPLQFSPTYNTNTGTLYPQYTNIGLHSVTVATLADSQIQLESLDANHLLGITLDNLVVTGGFAATPVPQYATINLGPGR